MRYLESSLKMVYLEHRGAVILAEERINWHQAFFGAIRLELDEYKDALEFVDEYQLTTEPLRIDVLIIKKKRDIKIEKKIAAVFRQDNIVEYKSPGDNFSIDDFNKTMAYCYLYASMNHRPVGEMTLTLVWAGYPRDVAGHIAEAYGWRVEEKWNGIHAACGAGMGFPIQFIESGKLSEGEDLWLRGLNHGLSVESMDKLFKESRARRIESYMRAYLEVIIKANIETFREVLAMGDLTVEEVIEKSGLGAKLKARGEAIGEARGEARARKEMLELLKSGKSPEDIIKIYGGQ
jgi:hypothetical protein